MHFTTREKVAKTFWFCDLLLGCLCAQSKNGLSVVGVKKWSPGSLQCRRILGERKLVNRIATMKPPSLIL